MAKLAWESIATARIGGDHVRRATLQRLRQGWEALAFRPGEKIEDFAVRLSILMQQMARNGDEDLIELRAVEKLLRCMPKYTQIVLTIETLLDFEALTIEEVTGRLKAVQDHKEAPPHRSSRRRREAAVHGGAMAGSGGEEQEGRRLLLVQGAPLASARRQEGQAQS
ncbi:uncharacterized protein [Miscanthus floridulus]|uniref:uncharacterized protein n=1 Tax=Miscanthus floridulus TaxID=154761 RepID=UPI00345A9F95